jgi:hypothetical protein
MGVFLKPVGSMEIVMAEVSQHYVRVTTVPCGFEPWSAMVACEYPDSVTVVSMDLGCSDSVPTAKLQQVLVPCMWL